jgi:hypothetical protein
MRELQFKIFHPLKPKGLNLTTSEKFQWSGLVIFIVPGILLYNINIPFIEYIFFLFIFIGFLIHFIGIGKRIGEYRNLNGYFEGNISFEENGLKINETEYLYKNIQNLSLNLANYYGKPTNHKKSGPQYENGTSNQITFDYFNKKATVFFQIEHEYLLTNLSEFIAELICTEKIPYNNIYFFTSLKDFGKRILILKILSLNYFLKKKSTVQKDFY